MLIIYITFKSEHLVVIEMYNEPFKHLLNHNTSYRIASIMSPLPFN